MEVKEAIFTRSSIRRYKKDSIADNDLAEIIAAGLSAPSAVNLQPWYFVVIKSEAEREKLMQFMQEISRKMNPVLQERFPNHPEVVKDSCRFMDNLGGAPVCILVFQYKSQYSKQESTIVQSVAAAISNMILMAHSKGIGSCWLTAPLETKMDRELKKKYAPDQGDMVAMISLGYPDQELKGPRRKDDRYIIL
jgi:nitroreductase